MNLTAFLPALSSNIIIYTLMCRFHKSSMQLCPTDLWRNPEKSRHLFSYIYIYISSFLYVNVQVRWDDHSIVPLDSSIRHT